MLTEIPTMRNEQKAEKSFKSPICEQIVNRNL